jgi:hypothetical protein
MPFTPGTTNSSFTQGYGSSISYAATTYSAGVYSVSGSYTKIAQSMDLQSPEDEVGDIKITNNDSPNNSQEYRPGMLDPGEMDFELIYTPAEHLTLHTICGDGNVYAFKEIFADGSNFVWFGWVKKIGVETKTENEAVKSKVTIRTATKPVFALS